MTSKNSFWASCIENHRRRVWVWIVAVLFQAVSYVGVLTVYLSRIRMWNEEGTYKTAADFQNAMYQATQDALGFQDNMFPILAGLAVIIGMQGFSYLYDRKKVDLYHSVPVDKNRRFFVVYVNGIVIYLVTTLLNILISVIMAMVQQAVNEKAMAVIGLGFVWNLLAFLTMYNTVILAVMVTGSRLVTLCAAGVLAAYEAVIYYLFNSLQYAFFKTKDNFYVAHSPKLSVLEDYVDHTWEIKALEKAGAMAGKALPYYGKWYVLAGVLLVAAWFAYRRRPSEAAGRAMAFRILEPFVKVAVVIPSALCLGMWVYSAGYGNKTLMLVTVAASGVIASAVMEVLYDFDLKSMYRHLLSSGIAVAGAVILFFVFKEDLLGYDKYIPLENEVESIAMVLDYYPDFWDEDFAYIPVAEASEEHMHIEDTAPVLALAARAQQKTYEEMDDPRALHVLYRLASGRRVGRVFYVDFSDADNAPFLDQITRMKEYKEGTFKILTDQDSFDLAQKITYSNGAVEVALPVEEALNLREAYLKDLDKFDFTMARNNRPCGEIRFRFPNWMTYTISVYENYENTIAYLQSREAYYPVQLNPEDIESITVTNYHYELQMARDESGEEASSILFPENSTVTETFYEEEQLAEIVQGIYPSVLSAPWNNYKERDDNYSVIVMFKKDTTYPYIRSDYSFSYQFMKDSVPAFVEEATALDSGESAAD